MNIELKSSAENNHPAFKKFDCFSKGGIIILNKEADTLNLHDLSTYLNLATYTTLPKLYITNQKLLSEPIGFKNDKLANKQNYKKSYSESCWGFVIEENISENDLLFFGYFILNMYKKACLVYSFETHNVYEITKKNKNKQSNLEKSFINRCKKLEFDIVSNYINNIMNDYIICSFDRKIFHKKYPFVILPKTFFKIITTTKIYFIYSKKENNDIKGYLEKNIIKSKIRLSKNNLIEVRLFKWDDFSCLKEKIIYNKDNLTFKIISFPE